MEYATRVMFEVAFVDFDYEAALPKYNLHGSRRSPHELLVVGLERDIEDFERDFGCPRV